MQLEVNIRCRMHPELVFLKKRFLLVLKIEIKGLFLIIAFHHSNHFYDILFQIPNNGLTNKLPAKEDIIQLAHVTIGRSQAKSLPVSFLQNEI